ncbi:CoA-transferase, partial [Rhizobium ruizarguesonis]
VGTKGVPAVGGAMDLVHVAKQVFVITEHVTKTGEPKLVDTCTFPLTGVACITRVYTSHAVIYIVADKGFGHGFSSEFGDDEIAD